MFRPGLHNLLVTYLLPLSASYFSSFHLLNAMTSTENLLTELPDDVMYKILLYLESPTRVIHQMATISAVSKHMNAFLTHEDNHELWEFILGGYYCTYNTHEHGKRPCSSSRLAFHSRTQRRDSKRLRRTSAKSDVIHAHFNLRDQTEMALQEVADMAISKIPKPLSLARLRATLNTYGPVVNIDQRSSIGGTFLVDVIKARCVKESVILACAKELIEQYGANPNVPATEGATYQHVLKRKKDITLPPLVVAAARGMPSVVEYLLQKHVGANAHAKGTSRFRLYTNSKKSISGCYSPLDFAIKMKEAEMEHGALENQLTSLIECIHLLSNAEVSENKI